MPLRLVAGDDRHGDQHTIDDHVDHEDPAADRAGDDHASTERDGGFRSIVDDDPREAIADLDAAIDRLARSRPGAVGDRDLLDAYAHLERTRRRLDAEHARLLEDISRRQAYREEAAVTVAGWLRHRIGADPTITIRRERIAERLRYFDQLASAWQAGDVDATAVHEICQAAIPQRRDAIVEAESALLLIARHGELRQLRRAIATIRDHTDPDGTDSTEKIDECRPDPRRHLTVSPTFDGLADLHGTLTQLTAETLLTLLDAYEQPDPPDTPDDQKRSAGQRRHDAFQKALRTSLDLADDLPDRQGRRPHLTLFCDLETLLARAADHDRGGDGATTTTGSAGAGSAGAWLRFTGPCDPALARHLALDASVTPILGMGDWRPVAVGREHRVAPAWLRHAIEWVHRHCRGPGCDRPVTWTQAAHTDLPWAHGGTTELDHTIPACTRHHQLIDLHGWTVAWNPDTNTVTWTSPDGEIAIETPPPPATDHTLRDHPPPQLE